MNKLSRLNPLQPYGRDRLVFKLSIALRKPAHLFAGWYRRTFRSRARVVVVTGSFGKTATTRAILAALDLPEHPKQTRSVNAFAWLAYLLWWQLRKNDTAVLEVGIGKPGQMHRYGRSLQPDMTVVTGVGSAHVANFPRGVLGIRDEKAELVAALSDQGVAILNIDNEHAMSMAARTTARVVTFGYDAAADVAAKNVRVDWPHGMSFEVELAEQVYAVRTKMFAPAGVYAALAAIAVAHVLGRDVKQVIDLLAQHTTTPNRFEFFELPNGAAGLLDDTKGTLATVCHAFAFFKEVPAKRRIGLLGHLPVGSPQPQQDYYEMGLAGGGVLDVAYLTLRVDAHYEAYRKGLLEAGMATENIVRLTRVHEVAEHLRSELRPGDVLLVKAHIIDRLSRVLLLLQGTDVRCRTQWCPRTNPATCLKCPLMSRDFDPPLRAEQWKNTK